jgi:hypothetical protein
VRNFVPADSIPLLRGRDSSNLYSPGIRARTELWKLAVEEVIDPRDAWCEFGVGEGESLDWFASVKPAENTLLGFDSFEGIPEPWLLYPAGQWRTTPYESAADDVRIVAGSFDVTLRDPKVLSHLTDRIGLLHIDCDLYSSTKCVFDCLSAKIQSGTVIVFDEFLNYAEWREHEAKAFLEFVRSNGVRFDYLVRTDWQLAVQIMETGVTPEWKVRPFNSTRVNPIISIEFGVGLAVP